MYPEGWTQGILQLIYKNGDKNNPNNNRDITLMSCFGKLFDQVLYNRLKCWESDHSVLHEEQAGFRSGYSTTDHIFTLQSLITASKHSKSKLYCSFIDFRKAFNSVYRDGLWYKIINMGGKGKLLTIVKNLYQQVKCCVRGHTGLTEFFLTKLGLQQGAILSPYLFALFVNDLVDIINENAQHDGVNKGGGGT